MKQTSVEPPKTRDQVSDIRKTTERNLEFAREAVEAGLDAFESYEEQQSATVVHDRVRLFGVEIDVVDMGQSVKRITSWIEADERTCKFVVTPNVDHVVMLQKNEDLQRAYREASLVVADGFPLVLASKWLKSPLPERVAGSELVPKLFDRFQERGEPTSVYLLGAMPGVAVKAAREINRKWPNIKVVGTYSPPFGFENDETECQAIVERVREAKPELVIFGVGAPKQELWTQRFSKQLDTKAILCVGATIDFLAGEKHQAPIWMRRAGLEWLHRCATEPKRLFMRYLTGARIFPQIVLREWLAKRIG